MADKGTGFHYYGVINTNEKGKYIFNLRFHSIQHSVNQWWSKECSVSLRINNRIIFKNRYKIGQKNYKSSISSATLEAGNNEIDIWFSCENLLSLNPKQDQNVYRRTKVEILFKSPTESDLRIIKLENLKHNLN